MTAKLAYEIIMTLPESERETLFDMLEPYIKPFELEDILENEFSSGTVKENTIKYLIETVFSKNKKS